jgi:hypothetical protein
VRLVNNAEIYRKSYGTWPYIYLCGQCGASAAVHPETIFPIGTMADKPLREARQRVHDALERVRRAYWLDVRQARERLARLMDIPIAACTIATFDAGHCTLAPLLCLKLTYPCVQHRLFKGRQPRHSDCGLSAPYRTDRLISTPLS